jgi:hypothetical protein
MYLSFTHSTKGVNKSIYNGSDESAGSRYGTLGALDSFSKLFLGFLLAGYLPIGCRCHFILSFLTVSIDHFGLLRGKMLLDLGSRNPLIQCKAIDKDGQRQIGVQQVKGSIEGSTVKGIPDDPPDIIKGGSRNMSRIQSGTKVKMTVIC